MERGNEVFADRKRESFVQLLPALTRQITFVIRKGGWSRRIGTPEEDIRQEILKEAWCTFEEWGGNGPRGFSFWVRPVIVGTLRNLFRLEWARKRGGDHRFIAFESLDDGVQEIILATECPLLAFLEEDERLNALLSAIQSLPPDDGRLVRLRFFKQLSELSLAALFNVSERTIRYRLGYALSMLAAYLRNHPIYKDLFIP